jgi:hypothetical protein
LTLPAEKKGKLREAGGEKGSGGRRPGKGAGPDTVGDALHSVYDIALAEAIPPEMLDLLGKLG